MPNLEPTYLRYIYDGLVKGSIHPENAAELPEGLIGLYEEAFDERTSVVERQKLLQRFAIWALLKKEVSAAFVAEVLGDTEDEIQDFISTYSAWFNSPESGKYQLYHERIKIYFLSKLSGLEIQDLSYKIIHFLKKDVNDSEFIDYKLRFRLHHLVDFSFESDNFKQELDNIIYQNDFWDKSFSVLQSTQPAVENLRNLIPFACFKEDWELLLRISNIVLHLEQKNDSWCEQILESKEIDFELAQFCFSSISLPLESLRFLSFLSVKIEADNKLNHIDLGLFWNELVSYVQNEYVNGALIMPMWIKQRLQQIAENQQLNSLTMVLDELDFDDHSGLCKGILKAFNFLQDETEMKYKSEIDLKQYRKLKKTLRTESNNFSETYKIINTPNLMDRDELLCRATLDLIEFNHSNSYDWLYWLLVKSDFEFGGHTFPDEKYYTKNLFAKFILKSDFLNLKKIENLLMDIDLFNYHKMEIRCWISDRYHNLEQFTNAFEVLNFFNYSIEPSFNESEWKSAWFVSQNKNFNVQELHVSKRLDTVLKYQHEVQKINFIDINTYLKPLDTDKVSKAEYFLDTAVRIYKTRKKLSEELVNASWELIKNTNDWASVIVKIETVVAALNLMPESWIKQKLKKIKDEFQVLWIDYESELTISFENFYNYHPSRFCDQNALKLAIGSKSVLTFLLEFDKEGLADAIENEKIEKLITQKANNIQNFRIFWTEFKAYFKSDGVACYIENFWSLFKNNKEVFQNITAEDIRIIGVISRKVGQHFPIELHIHKALKLQLYQDRITIPDDWEYGSSIGFIAMLSDKTLEKETVCNAILNSPRQGDELITTPISAVGYMLKEILRKKELVKNVQAFLKLRKEIVGMNA